jgi:hypothetical protein
MSAGWGGAAEDAQLARLRRLYPGWSIWRGESTGDYWAMPPRGHPGPAALIGARDLDELARSLAEAALAAGGRDSEGAPDEPS